MSKTNVEKALKNVAKTIKTLTIAKAPQSINGSNGNRAGNLKRKINTANTYSTMIKYKLPADELSDRPATVSVDYAPDGAEYGEFWDEPATNKSRTKGRPEFGFPTKAIENINVDAAIALYITQLENDLVEVLEKEIAKL
jgi:hypothetical protein